MTRALATPPGHWPWPVLAINLLGAFLLGALSAAGRRRPLPHRIGPLLGPGFCGAFTTFSALQLELLGMLDAHRLLLAALYATVSIAGGLLAVHTGARSLGGVAPAAARPSAAQVAEAPR